MSAEDNFKCCKAILESKKSRYEPSGQEIVVVLHWLRRRQLAASCLGCGPRPQCQPRLVVSLESYDRQSCLAEIFYAKDNEDEPLTGRFHSPILGLLSALEDASLVKHVKAYKKLGKAGPLNLGLTMRSKIN